jgi:hypothetical protein
LIESLFDPIIATGQAPAEVGHLALDFHPQQVKNCKWF